MTSRNDLQDSLNDIDISRTNPARVYSLLLEITGHVLDMAEAEGRDLALWEKASLNKTVTWLMHGKLGAARNALNVALARPDEVAQDAVREDEVRALGELAIADFRRTLKYLGALAPWM